MRSDNHFVSFYFEAVIDPCHKIERQAHLKNFSRIDKVVDALDSQLNLMLSQLGDFLKKT